MNKPSMTVLPKQNKAVLVLAKSGDNAETILKAGKGEILKQFEKICPTETSFQRMKKDMHDIFDDMLRQLKDN